MLSLLSLDSFLIDALNRCRVVQERAGLLYHLDYASDNPVKLARLISAMCAEFEGHLVTLRDRYEQDQTNVLNEIRFVDHLTRELGAHLRYVEGAMTSKLPWSLPRPLEQLALRFLPSTTLMLRPQWKYNYSIMIVDLGEHYRRILSRILPESTIDRLFDQFPPDFHIVSFPSIERTSALLHCDLGHEIGHLIAKQFLESEPKSYLVELRRRVVKYVDEQLAATQLPPLLENAAKTELISSELNRAVSMRERGLQEIISDMFAVHLFGPAALFALFDIAVGDDFDLAPVQNSSYYPPWRTRLRFGLQTLEDVGFLPIAGTTYPFSDAEKLQGDVTEFIGAIQLVTSDTSDRKAIDGLPLGRFVYDSIEEAIPAARSFLANEYGDKFIKPATLYLQIYPLVHRLCEGILPNAIEETLERSEGAELESILNAAWFYRISVMPKPFADGGFNAHFPLVYESLNRRTLKAIELAYVQKLYDEWSDKRQKET